MGDVEPSLERLACTHEKKSMHTDAGKCQREVRARWHKGRSADVPRRSRCSSVDGTMSISCRYSPGSAACTAYFSPGKEWQRDEAHVLVKGRTSRVCEEEACDALTVNLHGEAGGSVAWLQIGEMLDRQLLVRQSRGIKLCRVCVIISTRANETSADGGTSAGALMSHSSRLGEATML